MGPDAIANGDNFNFNVERFDRSIRDREVREQLDKCDLFSQVAEESALCSRENWKEMWGEDCPSACI